MTVEDLTGNGKKRQRLCGVPKSAGPTLGQNTAHSFLTGELDDELERWTLIEVEEVFDAVLNDT